MAIIPKILQTVKLKGNNLKKILFSVLAASSLVMAFDTEATNDNALVTHTELGYIQTSGNTKTKTFNLDAKVKKSWDKHIVGFAFDGQYADDDGAETKNKFFTELGYGYALTDRFAVDYIVGYKADKFSGFDYQAYTGPGVIHKTIVSETLNLNLSGNVLYSMDSYEDVYHDADGEVIEYPDSTEDGTLSAEAYDNNYIGYRVKGVFDWQMLENLKFDQELSFRGSFEEGKDYFVFSKTAFSSKISDIFSAGISYKVDYINLPAEGKESTDTTVTANLIIDY